MHRRIRNALMAASLIVIAGATSSEAAGGTPSPQVFDGEAIFRGVYFGEGRAAQVVHGTAWATPESHTAGDHVIASIRATSPGFLSAFAEDMYSGERPRISSALDTADEQLQTTVEQLGTATSVQVKGSFIVTSGIAIYADTGTVWAAASAEGQLSEEQLINHIAEELKR
jgi:hypothetical protein